MTLLTIFLAIIIALLGYPAGLIIAKLTKEELKSGKKWFKLIMIASIVIILSTLIFFHNSSFIIFIIASFTFIFLLALASFLKSKKQRKKEIK